ncbi:MAG: C4-dicarboxylate ABC transporter permease [Deltaproteobacteria bacterium HGW-Deltaproteobacteria-21]|nr:MAG: C4-dicarboxylate ABC transporter permease [Deltaproteobacteria bacterium HGW-Deltaproteobacteria-21]
MSPEALGIIGIGVVVLLMLGRMWIGLSMALVGFLGLAALRGMDGALGVLGTVPFKYVAFYPISAIPLFVFMAVIIANTGIGSSLFNSAHAWLGQLRGGLAMASIISCAGLAAIMGDSVAEVVTMSKVAVPEMKKYKYDNRLASGAVAAGGTLGILIPPSLGFIMYGILTEQSVGALFMAGILPGLLLTFLFLVTIRIIVGSRPGAGPAGPRTSFKQKIVSLKGTWHTLLLFVLIIGGIYAGIFTPTEAGAVGAFGAIVISVATRRLTFKGLGVSLVEATRVTAMIVLLIIGAFILMKFLAMSKFPFALAGFINDLALPRYGVLAAILILYVLLGMFLDVFAAVVLTIPVIFPVVTGLGFDPIWFGVIIVLILEMGLITPPVGMNVFALAGVTEIPLDAIFRGVLPFVAAMIVCVILLVLFPQIALFIPGRL